MPNTLEQQVNKAFNEGNYVHGIELLRQLAELKDSNPDVQHRLAVVEEQIGDPQKAKNAHLRCIELSPNFYMGYLYAGYWFQKNTFIEEAILLYSYAFDINSNAINLWNSDQHDQETRARSREASILLRKHFSTLHKNTIENGNASNKILEAIWTRTHDQKYSFSTANQKPHFFYIPTLTAKPYFNSNKFSWAQKIESNYQIIKSELVKVLQNTQISGRPYLDNNIDPESNLSHLAGSSQWTAFDLYKDGTPNKDKLHNFPKTQELLSKLPLYGINHNPYEIFFSLLKPKQHIKAHYGLSNHSLTVHLPLIVPDKCKLRVDDTWHNWEEGKLVIFDDTFDHEAINESEQERVVLIFSIWHPELTVEEQQDIKATFIARKKWLDSRTPIHEFCKKYLT